MSEDAPSYEGESPYLQEALQIVARNNVRRVAELLERACAHGWRSSPIEDRIIDPCPTCGMKSLFIGKGGYLTCASLQCKQPAVGRAIELLKLGDETRRRAIASASGLIADEANRLLCEHDAAKENA
jgi:hypothetical protein